MRQTVDQLPYLPDSNKESDLFSFSGEEPKQNSLPHGFPRRLNSDMTWKGADISTDHLPDAGAPYLVILQAPQLAEIDAALRYFQSEPATHPPLPFFSCSELTRFSRRAESANENLGPVNVSSAVLALNTTVRLGQFAFRIRVHAHSRSSSRTLFSRREYDHLCRDLLAYCRCPRPARSSIRGKASRRDGSSHN